MSLEIVKSPRQGVGIVGSNSREFILSAVLSPLIRASNRSK